MLGGSQNTNKKERESNISGSPWILIARAPTCPGFASPHPARVRSSGCERLSRPGKKDAVGGTQRSYGNWRVQTKGGGYRNWWIHNTHRKFNMEPENHWVVEENSLPNSIFRFHMLITLEAQTRPKGVLGGDGDTAWLSCAGSQKAVPGE